MSTRRMFSKDIVRSDAFLDLPLSTQALYFQLGMDTDDRGYIPNAKAILRLIGASKGDLELLVQKRFVLVREDTLILQKHFCINNAIRSDRFKESRYLNDLSKLYFDENKAYTEHVTETKVITIKTNTFIELKDEPTKENARDLRNKAYKESELPYSFTYKIRQAFNGKTCPICGRKMLQSNTSSQPTIQHNKPISKGGKHELDNISIICASCNSSIQNHVETTPYNTEEVKEIWEKIK